MTAALRGGAVVSLERWLRQPSQENVAGEDGKSEEAWRERWERSRNMSSCSDRRGEKHT